MKYRNMFFYSLILCAFALYSMDDEGMVSTKDYTIEKIESLDDLFYSLEIESFKKTDNDVLDIIKNIKKPWAIKQLIAMYHSLTPHIIPHLKIFEHITHLSFSSNALTDIEGIDCLPNLIELHVSHNAITALPQKLPSKLKALKVDHNKITKLDEIEGLSNLTSLDASYNMITDLKGLTPHISSPDFGELSITKNPLVGKDFDVLLHFVMSLEKPTVKQMLVHRYLLNIVAEKTKKYKRKLQSKRYALMLKGKNIALHIKESKKKEQCFEEFFAKTEKELLKFEKQEKKK
jgi:Leucine-rich repeat (LRR) protein